MPLEETTRWLYDEYGSRKAMGNPSPTSRQPHYFLLRPFQGDNDLLVILNTKRCRYQCHFCELPAKSSLLAISREDIVAQIEYVLYQLKHSLSIIDRITISNEGSVLDSSTFPIEALLSIAKCVHQIRRARRLILETRIEFVDRGMVLEIQRSAPRVTVDILTGFETLDANIRDGILFKQESLDTFTAGLDKIAETQCDLTCYVLYKPSPVMSDDEAFVEAELSIDYLVRECHGRKIPLTIRLNPMYIAKGSRWADLARQTPSYKPPRLTDVMRLAEKKTHEGVRVYIGLSNEGLGGPLGTYAQREDYSPSLIKQVILFNDAKTKRFKWDDH